ncbi:hypothetical protein [Winogradskya humida]|uniref:hypothetical protein n=1 Tax=Winogradskya humida TaxID=113566 RepID=UPI001942D341|nr:hypothetical protein [Actinoplanes humidus]
MTEPDAGLPLRWALLVVVALGGGLAVGMAAGLVPGVMVGLGAAGLLHSILPK